MEASQQQEEQSFNDERAVIASELHTIVDNLQPETEPQVEQPRRPFWQRAVMWQVPLFLVALAVILMYNPRVDNCNGFKITYKKQLLCISSDADFFLFVEHYTCDFIEKGKSAADSLEIDFLTRPKLAEYFDKHKFSLEIAPTEAEVLRGMRGVYDSASFCKNLSRAYWNAGVRYNSFGQKDSACYYFGKLYDWTWKDSVLTRNEHKTMMNMCNLKPEKRDTNYVLNQVNQSLNNINNVLQNRINKKENKGKLDIQTPKTDEKEGNFAGQIEQKKDAPKFDANKILQEFYGLFKTEWTGEILDSMQAKVSLEYKTKKYGVYAKYNPKRNRITIDYPSFPCSSEWLFKDIVAVKENEYVLNFTENLTANVSNCENNESIQIYYNRDTPNYCQLKYYHVSLGLVAQGYLRAGRGTRSKK